MEKCKFALSLIFHGKFDTSSEQGRENERLRRIFLTSLTAMVSKALSMLVPIITVRITFNYLGEELYGLWNAVVSFFALFAFADLGLGTGLQSGLSKAYGKNNPELCQKLVSSTFAMLLIVTLVLLTVFMLIFPMVDWGALMNAKTQFAISSAGSVVLAIVISRLLSVSLNVVQRTQLALQEGYDSYIWQSIGSIFSLVSVVFVSYLGLSPLIMIWVSSMCTPFIAAMNMLIYFCFIRKELRPQIKYVDLNIIKIQLKIGFQFLILSILTTLGLSLDNFIVASAISLTEAATYSILYKVTNLIGVLSSMISQSLWGATGEAMARHENAWVWKIIKKTSTYLLFISLAASLGVILLLKPAMYFLLGQTIDYSIWLVVGMCLVQVQLAFISPFFTVLNSLGLVKIQILLFSIYTPVVYVSKYYLANYFGAVAIPWSGIICYGLIIIPWILYTVIKVVKKNDI